MMKKEKSGIEKVTLKPQNQGLDDIKILLEKGSGTTEDSISVHEDLTCLCLEVLFTRLKSLHVENFTDWIFFTCLTFFVNKETIIFTDQMFPKQNHLPRCVMH